MHFASYIFGVLCGLISAWIAQRINTGNKKSEPKLPPASSTVYTVTLGSAHNPDIKGQMTVYAYNAFEEGHMMFFEDETGDDVAIIPVGCIEKIVTARNKEPEGDAIPENV